MIRQTRVKRVSVMVVLIALIFMGPQAWSRSSVPSANRSWSSMVHFPDQVTSEMSPVLHMDISKDGQWIVYTRASATGDTELWLRSLAPGTWALSKQLTTGSGTASDPAFFPDSRYVVYIGMANDVKGDLYLLDLQDPNTGPQRLTDRDSEDGGPCVSPDGRTIYFHQARPGSGRYLAALDVATRSVRPLDTGGDAAFPAISPDGQKIAFVTRRHHASGDIWLLDLNTQSVTALTDDPAMDLFPSWSPDGTRVVFTRFPADTDANGTVDERDHAAIYAISESKSPAIAFPLTSLKWSALRPKLAGSHLFFLSDRKGVTNCWKLPAHGRIPNLGPSDVQIGLAQKISTQVPPDPYLAILAWSRVLERFFHQPAIGAQAAYEMGMIWKSMGLAQNALDALALVPRYFGTVVPYAPFSRIEQTMITADRDLKNATDQGQRSRILDSGVRSLDAIVAQYAQQPGVQARARLAHARLLQTVGDSKSLVQAIEIIDAIARDYPGRRETIAEAMVLKADIYRRIGMTPKVYPAYIAVVKNYPDIPQWATTAVDRVLDLAISDAGVPDFESKIQLLAKINQDNRKSLPLLAIGALVRMGDLYYEADQVAGAKAAYRQVLEQYPENTTATASARLALAEVLYREQRYRQALDLYEAQLQLSPNEDHIYHLARDGYIRKSISAAENQFRLGEITGARALFKELIDYDDTIIEAHRGYIKCAAAVGHIQPVLQAYQARAEANPSDPVAVYATGLCLTYLEDRASLEQAKDYLIRAISLNGQVEYFYQTLGYVYEVLETVHHLADQLEMALDAYQKAYFFNDAAKNPENAAHLLLNLANINYLLGQYAGAFQLYSQRLETGIPFDNPNTEIVFYKRLGESAFQSGNLDQTLAAYTQVLDLIHSRMDPQQVARTFNRIHRYVMDRLLTPASRRPQLAASVKTITQQQSEIGRQLYRLNQSEVFPPPSAQWTTYHQRMAALLKKQQALFPQLVELIASVPDFDPDSAEVQRTLDAMYGLAQKALDFPQRLVQLDVEIRDRMALVYQESEQWEQAIATFESVYDLNQRMGANANLGRNRRSIAYNRYMLAGNRSGDKRMELLHQAASDFEQVIQLVEKYGVPETKSRTPKTSSAGLIGLTIQTALDEATATQAAYGFTADQEIRLAKAFLARIRMELGDIAGAEQAISRQIALYPSEKPVANSDMYGISLLFHRAGLVAAAMGDWQAAFDRFHRSADLTIRMKQVAASVKNVLNMSHAFANGGGDRHVLYQMDQQVCALFSYYPSDVHARMAASYHNAMGVYELKETKDTARRVPTNLLTAADHFLKGLKALSDGQEIYGIQTDREVLAVRSTLYLNLAWTARQLGEPRQAIQSFEKALETATRGVLPHLKWRAQAGLGQLDAALETLRSVTVLEAQYGCGPGEIVATFAPLVRELVAKGDVEKGFYLAEQISELERFHRLTAFIGTIDPRQARICQEIYPRLQRIEALRRSARTSEGGDRLYYQKALANESKWLESRTGTHFEQLPEIFQYTDNESLRYRMIRLIGMAAEALELARNMARKPRLSPDDSDLAKYQEAIRQYRQLQTQAALEKPGNVPADLLTFFGPEPVEAMDVMEALPPDGVLIRLFPNSHGGWLVFRVTSDDIQTSEVTGLAELDVADAGTCYVACDDPTVTLPWPPACRVFNSSHLVRSLKSVKPFKQALWIIPAGKPLAGYRTLDRPASDKKVPPRVQTLLVTGPVRSMATVPTRAGELPQRFLAIDLERDGNLPLRDLLVNSTNLSLAIISDVDPDAMWAVGHLFSIFGCPTVLMSAQKTRESAFPEIFLQLYRKDSANAARIQAMDQCRQSDPHGCGRDSWMQLGYAGMTPAQAMVLAKKQFAGYVKKGKSAYQTRPAQALIWFENAIQVASESKQLAKYLSPLYTYARNSAFKTGQLEKAAAWGENLVKLMESQQPDSKKHAEALLQLGLIYARMEANEKAIPLLEQATQTLADLELDAEQAKALADLGVVLENATDYDRALIHFQSAAELSTHLGKQEFLGHQYRNIGRIQDLRLNRYARAIAAYQTALEIYTELKRDADIAQSLLDIGRCYRLLGNFANADAHYQKALERAGDGDAKLRAKILIEQANNAWYQARYQEAFTRQRQAYQLAVEHQLPLMQVICLNTSGLIWWTLGDYPKAMAELEKALTIAKTLHARDDEIATTLNNMGQVLRAMGQYPEAMEKFNEALAIDQRLKSRWAIAHDLRNQAMTWLKMDHPEKAIPLLETAVSETRAIGNRINEARSLLSLADALRATNRLAEAETTYARALELSRQMRLREIWWRSLHGMAHIKLAAKDRDTAIQLLTQALDVIEGMRSEIRINQLKSGFITNKLAVYQLLVRLLADMGKPLEAFDVAERSRARNFIDLLGNQQLSLSRSVDQALYSRQQRIRQQIAETEAFMSQATTKSEKATYEKLLEELRRDFNDVMMEIQAQNPQLASLVTVAPLSVTQLMKILEPGTALLAYYVLPEEILCWVVKPTGVQLFRTPLGLDTLAATVMDFRRMIQNLEPLETTSRQLYDWLVAPVASSLEQVSILGIIPHGTLHYLSFATLSDGNQYLIEQHPLFYLPSASILKYTMKKRAIHSGQAKNAKILAIGNPDLGDPALDLPFAEFEVDAVKWNFPDFTILTRERATESWVRDHIEEFGIIYLASHGEFDPINPLFSAIKLSKDSQSDGNLEATEVFGLRINADMVVLSACQTGLGKVTAGDEIIGLNRAFFYAGAHTVVSSLWRVSDISTAILMKTFSRQYLNLDKARSLQRAVLHVKKQYPHPGYWGAFTLVGDYQ